MLNNRAMLQSFASTAPSDGGASDKDAAWTVVSDVAREIDPSIEKRVLRKIDLFFMPAMVIGMFIKPPRYNASSDRTARIWNRLLG